MSNNNKAPWVHKFNHNSGKYVIHIKHLIQNKKELEIIFNIISSSYFNIDYYEM
mgnify:CR=1 FL=1